MAPVRRVAPALLAVVLVSGCAAPEREEGARPEVDVLARAVTFAYERVGGTGFIDQALTIDNPGDTAVVLTGRIVPLDDAGERIPGVEATSVYGVERAGLVVLPGTNVDFLVFNGPRSGEVRDVRLSGLVTEEVEFGDVTDLVEAVPLDDSGAELDYPVGFRQVALRNPNAVPASVRLVSIAWNDPRQGESQQALEVLPVAGPVVVPASGELVVDVDAVLARRIARLGLEHALSLKAYYSR